MGYRGFFLTIFKKLFSLFALFTLLNSAAIYAGQSELNAELLKRDSDFPELKTWLMGRPILFIGGFIGKEVLQYTFRYLRDFETESRRLSLNPKIIYPSSLVGIEETDEEISRAIRDLYFSSELDQYGHHKPVIVIGHSMGAARLWVTLLNHPEILEQGMLEAGIGFQGCFGGSFLAGNEFPWILSPWNSSYVASLPGGRGFTALKTAKDGANSVHQSLATLIYEKHDLRTKKGKEFLMKLHKKLYYIKTEVLPKDLSLFSWGAQMIFRSTSASNDGMVSLEHQQISGKVMAQLLAARVGGSSHGVDATGESPSYLNLGTLLSERKLRADHLEMTTGLHDWAERWILSSDLSEKRRTFLREVLIDLYTKKLQRNLNSKL